MVCSDCGNAIGMNQICKNPIQSATNMLKHMAVHNASRAFASVANNVAQPDADDAPSAESKPSLSASDQHWTASILQPPN